MAKTRDAAIGENLRRLRGERSQQSVADEMREIGHAKWSQATVWAVEKGTRPLRLVEAVDLAQVLGAPHLEVIFESEEESKLSHLFYAFARRKRLWREALYGMLDDRAAVVEYLDDPTVHWDRVDPDRVTWVRGMIDHPLAEYLDDHVARWESGERRG